MSVTYTPVEYFTGIGHKGRVTSPFGMRTHPITGYQRMHWGIDVARVPRGHPWTTPYPGKVTHLGTHGGRGKVAAVRIQGTKILQLFQHLDKFLCQRGDQLNVGGQVGTNGITGDVTGSHLHYELRIDNGTPLGAPVWGDPADFRWEGGAGMRKTHVVVRGDTLAQIARKYGVTVQELRLWNNRTPDQDRSLKIGTVLFVEPNWKQMAQDLEKQVKKLEDEAEARKEYVALQDQVIDDLKGDIAKAQKKIDTQATVIADLRAELKDTSAKDKAKLEDKLAESRAKIEQLNATVDKLVRESEEQGKTIIELSAELDSVLAQRNQLQVENDKLQKQLENLQRKYKNTLILDMSWSQLVEIVQALISEAFEKFFRRKAQ